MTTSESSYSFGDPAFSNLDGVVSGEASLLLSWESIELGPELLLPLAMSEPELYAATSLPAAISFLLATNAGLPPFWYLFVGGVL